jgi:glycosyltransferase involved in cell wall biosynthesis
MSEGPLVSIILPTYNRAHFLPEAVGSVLAQTYRNWELIVVDDGSTDHTREVAEGYGDERIRYLYQANKGCSAARNLGIKNSRGEFIAFLDSDDMWLPERLEVGMRAFEEHPSAGMVCSGCYRVGNDGAVVCESKADLPVIPFEELQVRYAIPGGTPSVTVRMAALEEVGLFDESLARNEDWDLWLRLARRFEIRAVARPLVKIRWYDRPSGRQEAAVNRATRERLIERYCTTSADRRRAAAWRHYEAALTHYLKTNRLGTCLCLARSFIVYPSPVCRVRRYPLLLEALLPAALYRSLAAAAKSIIVMIECLLPDPALRAAQALKHWASRGRQSA